jgi:hypothetical protein
MPGLQPNPILLYRIVHIKNMEYILSTGVYTPQHPLADPGYINIGDTQLIEQRKSTAVRIDPPGGNIGDYVPFYFGPWSPMLLNISTGWRGIRQVPQSEIVYIVCSLPDTIASNAVWFFTDGHAKDLLTSYYNDFHDLAKIDWDVVGLQYWNDIETDRDRKRRKQAEFLIKDGLTVNLLRQIIVYDQQAYSIVKAIVNKLNLQIAVSVDIQSQYYYP